MVILVPYWLINDWRSNRVDWLLHYIGESRRLIHYPQAPTVNPLYLCWINLLLLLSSWRGRKILPHPHQGSLETCLWHLCRGGASRRLRPPSPTYTPPTRQTHAIPPFIPTLTHSTIIWLCICTLQGSLHVCVYVISISHLTSINHCLIWSCICSFMSGPSVSANLSLMVTSAYTWREVGSHWLCTFHWLNCESSQKHTYMYVHFCISAWVYSPPDSLSHTAPESVFAFPTCMHIQNSKYVWIICSWVPFSLYLLCDANCYTADELTSVFLDIAAALCFWEPGWEVATWNSA